MVCFVLDSSQYFLLNVVVVSLVCSNILCVNVAVNGVFSSS
jgi:hypothetical protein